MIGLNLVYPVAGLTFVAFAWASATDAGHPRRIGNAAFWALIAIEFLAGDAIGDIGNGLLAIALVVLAGTGTIGRAPTAEVMEQPAAGEPAAARGNRIFLPALVIPGTALLGTISFKAVPDIVDPKQATLVALTLGVVLALALCLIWLRPGIATPLREGGRLMDAIGWAAVLPQMLASLGAIFALAGVGSVVGGLIGQAIPAGSVIGAVLAYAVGMAGFTMLMGNAFAAFPVMFAAVGMPVLIVRFGASPAVVAAVGMLAGFCGTLMTPMAANFNLVPAALLDLKDRYGVIRAQVPTALILLGVNIAILYAFGFAR